MPNKILNTNMGLGFQRHRKYDMDFDRFGRIETSQGELRKTGELNMQKELKKLRKTMKTYSIRRFSSYPYCVVMTESELKLFSEVIQREFGMGDVAGGVVNGARDVTGSAVEGAGKLVGSTAGKLIGGGFGAMKGAALGMTFGGPLGAAVATVPGFFLGGAAGTAAAGVAGNTLKNIGRDIHT